MTHNLAVMTEAEALIVQGMVDAAGLRVYCFANPFNDPYWIVLVETASGIRCLTSVLRAEWFLAGYSASERERLT